MKRILALILALASMVTLLGTSQVMAEEEDYSYYMTFAQKLRIIGDVSPKESVTRGQFADYLNNILTGGSKEASATDFFADDYNNTLLEAVTETTAFIDVSESNPYYKSIEKMYDFGIMKGTGLNSFSPDRELTYSQAATALIRMLGYGARVENGNYVQFAENLGMFDGMSYDSVDKITVEELARVLYNCFDINIMKIDTKGGNVILTEREGVNIYQEYMDVYKTRGQMEKNPYTSIFGDTALRKNAVVIDKVTYIAGEDYALYDLIGRDVEIFYKEDKDDDIKTVLWGYARNRDEAITISSDNIVDFNDYKLTYYENDKARTKDIKRNAKLIYNGQYKGSFSAADFIFENGDVTIIKPVTENEFSIIIINDYTTMKVTRADAASQVMYAEKAESGAFSSYYLDEKKYDANEVQYYLADGTKTDIKSVSPGMVVDVMENTGYVKVIITNNIISGAQIKSVGGEDDKGITYTLNDGGEYIMPKSYLTAARAINAEPQLGKLYNIALNSFGKIAYVESATGVSGTDYVYVTDLRSDSFTDDYAIEYLNSKGEIVLSRMKVGATVNMERDSFKMKDQASFEQIKITDRDSIHYETEYRGVALLKLDAEGFITELTLPVIDNKDRDNVFGTIVKEEPLRYCSGRLKYFENIASASSMVMFSVDPDASKPAEERYNTMDFSKLYNGDKERTVTAYNFYSDSAVAYCMVVEIPAATEDARFLTEDEMYVVTEVYEGVYDGEPVTMVKMNTGGRITDTQELLYPAKGDCITNAGTFFDQSEGVSIKKGDIIYANIKDGYITKALLVYRIFHADGESPLYGTVGRYKTSASDAETKLNPYGVQIDLSLYNTYTGEGALNRVKTNAHHRFMAANLLNFELNEYVTYTTLDINEGTTYDKALVKQNQDDYGAYITETIALPYRYTLIEVNGKNISVRKATTADFITYKQAGKDCTELFMDTSDGQVRTMFLINEVE